MKRIWFPLYDGDLVADTMHLSATEFGIYVRLIIHAYNHHGEIPTDPARICHITGCDARLWWQYQETVLQFFDTVDASTMQHKRVVTELRRSHEISNKRKDAAMQMHSKRNANAYAKGGVITAQHKDKKEPDHDLARNGGSIGSGSKPRTWPSNLPFVPGCTPEQVREYIVKLGKNP